MVLEELKIEESISTKHLDHCHIVDNLNYAQRIHTSHVDSKQVAILHAHLLLFKLAIAQSQVQLHQFKVLIIVVFV